MYICLYIHTCAPGDSYVVLMFGYQLCFYSGNYILCNLYILYPRWNYIGVSICICICVRAHMYVYIYTSLCTSIYRSTYLYPSSIYVAVHAHIHAYIQSRLDMYVYVHMLPV